MGQADSYETINTRIALCDDVQPLQWILCSLLMPSQSSRWRLGWMGEATKHRTSPQETFCMVHIKKKQLQHFLQLL